jgi:hypothetical protein
MRKYLFAGTGILLLAVMAWAGDVWKDKPYDQWTEKDVLTVLQSSPWAKSNLSAAGAWRPMDSTALTGQTPGMVAGSSNDPSKTAQGSLPEQRGGSEKSASSGPQTYNAYWWSSRTIRKAFVRYSVLKGRLKSEDAPKMVDQPIDDYQILVQGQNMYLFEQRGAKAFEDAAFLEMKKAKTKLSPSKVVFQFGPDGKAVTGVVFHFSKTAKGGEPSIGPNEQQVYFYLHIGDSTLQTFFEPKKMVDAKGEDL